MTHPVPFTSEEFDSSLEELFAYLRIPSISTLPEHQPDMMRAAEWTAAKLRQIGMSRAEVIPTQGHPLVYGEWLGAPGAPTVLIYGHYDVQPPDPLREWVSPPFEPVIHDEHVVARGAADDKGQVFINLKAIETLMRADGKLPVNVKFIIEGEEEIGSAQLEKFVIAHADELKVDVIVISDTTMLSLQQPAISTSFRGHLSMEVEVQGPAFDLHSGQHGGVVHNPIVALCEIIAQLHNEDRSVAVPGFYDRVRAISNEEREELAALYDEAELRRETGAPRSWGEEAFSLRERIVARPTLELTGIVGGYTGEGTKSVLPARALAKIACRLVADQDPVEIAELVRQRITELTPPTVTSSFRVMKMSYPVSVPVDNAAIEAAVRAYEHGFGVKPIFMRKGGSLPIVATFNQVFGAPIVLAGYGLPSDRVHGPNERFHLDCLRRGWSTAVSLYRELGKLPPEAYSTRG